MSALEWTDIYVVHNRRTQRNSSRKFAWVGFEPRVAEFHSEALTDCAIRPWSQFIVRTKFAQLLQFHQFVLCSRFISVIAFVSQHICFKRNLGQLMTWVQRNERIHIVFTTEGFWKKSIESWPERSLNLQILNSVESFSPTVLSGHELNWQSEPTLYSYFNLVSLLSIQV